MIDTARSNAMSNDVDALKEDLGRLRADVADLARTLLGVTKTEVGEVKDRLQAEAERRLEQMTDAARAVKDRGVAAMGEVRHQIEQRPITVVLSAVAVGCIIGLLVNRRS
jgi:ElaB/YqjD/DUF883 family membrane-anchored ribosome-binding protein